MCQLYNKEMRKKRNIMIKESRAKVLPKEYKNETDYRKIPREYLESNIPLSNFL